MTVVLWDINVAKRSQNQSLGKVDPTSWSLDDYYDVARRCIGAFALGPLASTMLKNEDAISYVAEHLMYGAFRWEEGKGRTLRSYLNQCAIWSILVWVSISRRSLKHSALSLNDGPCLDSQLHELIKDEKSETPEQIVLKYEQTEYLTNVIRGAGLTERQQYCLDYVYMKGQRASSVARDLGVSRQAVEQCLKNGIRKIRMTINDEEKHELLA